MGKVHFSGDADLPGRNDACTLCNVDKLNDDGGLTLERLATCGELWRLERFLEVTFFLVKFVKTWKVMEISIFS